MGSIKFGTKTLTKGYTQLRARQYELLESVRLGGNGYFITQFKGNEIGKFEIKYSFLAATAEYSQSPFGSIGTSNSFAFINATITGSSNLRMQVGFGPNVSNEVTGNQMNRITTVMAKVGKMTVKYNDGESHEFDSGSLPSANAQPLYIGALNNNGGVAQRMNGNIYYCYLYGTDGETLIAKYVPVKRLSDNAIGLLNAVDGTFIQGSSGITLTPNSYPEPMYDWTDVTPVQYIEGTGTQYIDIGTYAASNACDFEVDCQFTALGNVYIGQFIAPRFDLGIYNGQFFGGIANQTPTTGVTGDTERHIFNLSTKSKSFKIDGVTKSTYSSGSVSTANLYLFARNWTTMYYTKMKIYRCRLTNNDVLVKDLLPVKYGDEYCMLNLVDGTLLQNKGTGSFIGGELNCIKTIEPAILANGEGYIRLDYLQSDGNQCIDTGLTYQNNDIVKTTIEMANTDLSQNNTTLFGSFSNPARSGYIYYLSSGNQYRFAFGSGDGAAFSYDSTNMFKIEVERNGNNISCKFNGGTATTYTNTDSRYTGVNEYLFSGNNAGSANWKTAMKCYHYKVEVNNVLKLDLIPAKRISDGVLGMVDIVTGAFKTNTGTGTFVAGPSHKLTI